MFSKILIANRGEIAVRIIRACREMGISTVAIYSEADKNAMHVQLADESYCVGGSRVADSYLNMPAILTVAIESGAQAIHPGYGLLSENAKFVSLCEQCNINFIGPTSEMIKLLGDKDNARKTMRAAGVPVTPGCDIIEDPVKAREEAEKIGFPLLIKARSGGGGKGIRRVDCIEQFDEAFAAASSEAQSAFGDGACYMEKFIHPVKHIEMQLLSDKYGNTICLGERECSVLRKNQKMIEESPSPALDDRTRKEMMKAAVKAAKAVNYVNAGTVEFLLDMNNNFYFMEMNTRLQVEHGVTEMVTGLDIVQWQIRIAAGGKLTRTQDSIFTHGNVIECRINAEDPEHGFRPSCGRIKRLHIPGGSFVRFDTAVFLTDFPPELASLAKTRIDEDGELVAARFELYIEGLELANAYDELIDAEVLRSRFEADNAERAALGLHVMPIDEYLLAALPQMPECSGIALGLDRLLMIATNQMKLEKVITFPAEIS